MSNSSSDEFTPERLLAAGWEARERDRPEDAHDCFIRSLDTACEMGDQEATAHALLALANNAAWYCPKEDNDALLRRQRLARKALNIFRELGHPSSVVDCLRTLAACDFGDESVRLLREAVSVSRDAGDERCAARALSALANQLFLTGDAAGADAAQAEALVSARSSADREVLADVLESLGIRFKGALEERRMLFEEAQAIRRELGQKASLGRNLLICSAVACDLDELERREGYLQTALALWRELDSDSNVAHCLNLLAAIAQQRGDEERAARWKSQRPVVGELPTCSDELGLSIASGDREEILRAARNLFRRKPDSET